MQPHHPTMAQTFQCAFAVFERALWPIQPTEDAIVRLSLSVDKLVQFHIGESLDVTFKFSDGSFAVLAAREITIH